MEWTSKDFEELTARVSHRTLDLVSGDSGRAALVKALAELAVKISVVTVQEYEAMKAERQESD